MTTTTTTIGLVGGAFAPTAPEGHMSLVIDKAHPDAFSTTVLGVVKEGAYAGKFVSLQDDDVGTSFVRLQSVLEDIRFIAVLDTPLTKTGETYVLHFADASANLGYASDGDRLLGLNVVPYVPVPLSKKAKSKKVAMSTAVASPPVATPASGEEVLGKKKQLKRAVLSDGSTLNRDATIQALLVWLDDVNSTYGPTHGVDRLAWCREATRTDGTMQRSFLHMDLNTKRPRACSNATAAMAVVKTVTGKDFYQDMLKLSPDELPATVKQGGSSKREREEEEEPSFTAYL